MHTILVLGGYGFFGARICGSLATQPNLRLLVAGRHAQRARAAARSLSLAASQGTAVDARAADLADRLRDLRVNTVVHAAGPFQGQSHAVAQAAIAADCNYVDLADGRDFVVGISTLDAQARARGVTVVSGASSVPALSSAVVDRYRRDFARLDTIRVGISSGARAPGVATVRGVFSYCGKPVRCWQGGSWRTAYGWLGLTRHRFPAPVGARWLGTCNVPDLELFPQRYSGVREVSFQAGFASTAGHLVVWSLARLVKAGLLSSASVFATPLHQVSRWIEPLVSSSGGMFVSLAGVDTNGTPLAKTWYLIAGHNHGPQIPCAPAIALALKLARGAQLPAGALPCMGLLSVEDILAPLQALDIREVVT